MVLKIKNNDFLNSFLTPLSKVTDSAIININKGKISSLVSASDNTIIVSAIYNDNSIDASKTLNIPDLKKFCRVLSCIDTNEYELDISSNFIGYTSKSMRFKYHLYDEGIITSPKVNIEKVKSLEFDGNFTLASSSIINLIKGSSICTDSNKLYLSVKDKDVLGEITDKVRANVDSYGINISNNYEGVQFAVPIPLNFEIFRIISSMRFKDINARLVSKMGVLTFDLNLDNTEFKFIISALAN